MAHAQKTWGGTRRNLAAKSEYSTVNPTIAGRENVAKQRIDHDRLFKELLSTFFEEFLLLFFPHVYEQTKLIVNRFHLVYNKAKPVYENALN